MPRAPSGAVYLSGRTWYARVTLGPSSRPSFALPDCRSEDEARRRLGILAELAAELRELGAERMAPTILEAAARGTESAVATAREAVERLRVMDAVETRSGTVPRPVTFKEFGERWTSGELAREYPDHVRPRKKAAEDAGLLRKHVYAVKLSGSPWPTVGAVPLPSFTLDNAQAVLRALDASLEPSTRRFLARLMGRVVALAMYPARLIASNPIPRGFAPSSGERKAFQWLYPDEDARLLACTAIPLERRVYYGVLAREGMRPSEGTLLELTDLDAERGTIALDINKTRDPRTWVTDPGVVRALRRWIELRPRAKSIRVFVSAGGAPLRADGRAELFREDLRTAGIERAALFKVSAKRRPIRAHDLRATFITLSLAHGKTEAWISARTGHRSSNQINGYRRPASTAAELNLPPLTPLDEAIPELRRPVGIVGESSQGGEAKSRSIAQKPLKRSADEANEAAGSLIFGGRALEPPPVGYVGDSASVGDHRPPITPPPDASRSPSDASSMSRECDARSPRVALLERLAAELPALIALGDVDAASIVYQAIGMLIAPRSEGATEESEPVSRPIAIVTPEGRRRAQGNR